MRGGQGRGGQGRGGLGVKVRTSPFRTPSHRVAPVCTAPYTCTGQGGGPAAFFQAVDKATGGVDEDGDGVPDNDEDGGESEAPGRPPTRTRCTSNAHPPSPTLTHPPSSTLPWRLCPRSLDSTDDPRPQSPPSPTVTSVTHLPLATVLHPQSLSVYLVPTRACRSGTATARRRGGQRGRS